MTKIMVVTMDTVMRLMVVVMLVKMIMEYG